MGALNYSNSEIDYVVKAFKIYVKKGLIKIQEELSFRVWYRNN